MAARTAVQTFSQTARPDYSRGGAFSFSTAALVRPAQYRTFSPTLDTYRLPLVQKTLYSLSGYCIYTGTVCRAWLPGKQIPPCPD